MVRRSAEYINHIRTVFPQAFDLFYAVIDGTPDEVKARLDEGDDPNTRDAHGSTPLFIALRTSFDKAAILLEAGANIDVWTYVGMHPIHFANHSPEILTWLLQHGADVDTRVKPGRDGQLFYPAGWTALHITARRKDLSVAELLLRNGADPNARDEVGMTPLHSAMRPAYGALYKRLVRTLIDAGADVDAVDAEGRTALHYVCTGPEKYYQAVLKLLVHRGARVDLKDSDGCTPIDYLRSLEADHQQRLKDALGDACLEAAFHRAIKTVQSCCGILERRGNSQPPG